MVEATVSRMLLVPVPVASGVLWLPVPGRMDHRPGRRPSARADRPADRPPSRPGRRPPDGPLPARAALRHDFRFLLGDRSAGGRPRSASGSPDAPPSAGTGLAAPSAGRADPGRPTGARAALLIATGRLAEPGPSGPDGALDDTERLRVVLADPDVGGYAVTVLADRTSREIRWGVETFLAGRTADDQVFVHVSAPTVVDPAGRLLLAGTDTCADRLPATAVDVRWLVEQLDLCAARCQIVLLDTGWADAQAPLWHSPAPAPANRTREVIAAARPPAADGDDRPPSLTALLAEGLASGHADADEDGLVSLDEAYAYLQDRTPDPDAAPRRWTRGGETLLLARRPAGAPDADPAAAHHAPPTHDAAPDETHDETHDAPPPPEAAPTHETPPTHDVAPPQPPHQPPPHTPDPDVMRAMRVARSLDPAQALAAVQGLDAAEVMDVAQALKIPQLAVPPPGALPAPPPLLQPERTAGTRRRQIGDILVENGVLTPEQRDLALAAQRDHPGPRPPLGKLVVDLGLAGEREVAECLALLLNLELVDLSRTVPDPDLVRLLPRALAERIRVLVIARTPRGEPVVAASDPTNVVAFDDVRLYTRSTNLKICIAIDSQISDQINRVWSLESDTSGVAEIVEEVTRERQEEPEQWQTAADDDAPIVRLVNQILADGVRLRASDIHLEVQRDTLRVRYRVDGLLRDVMEAPRRVATSVISRIKIISGLDIAERRIPQDGRTRLTVEGSAIDARVSTLPSLHGEKVVIRLLTRGDAVPSLASLGLEPEQLALLETALAAPQGLVLITGPTGSGKTNTLYSAIARIRCPELNIVTLEDPVEVQLPGITQVGVSDKTGMTFSRGLRAILRQDPDVILVGEVRDGETAQLALKAAMTGHLVLTTLHTNSAVAALTRMVDMGAEPFVVASSLTLSVAQRLVRCPCAACAAPYRPDDVTLGLLGLTEADLDGATPQKGTGCPECGGTGYRGRTAVYEVLDVDGPMRQVLLHAPTEAAIAAQAASTGMIGLRAAAVAKALQGRTTFEEALRVTSR